MSVPSPVAGVIAPIDRKIARLLLRLERSPRNVRLLQALGAALIRRANRSGHVRCYADAEAAFRRAVIADAADPWSHLYMACVFFSQRQYRRSLAAARYVSEISPRLGLGWKFQGDAHDAMKDHAAAGRCYRIAATVDPECGASGRALARWEAERDRRRARAGSCRDCGYHLGNPAAPARCPECGAVPEQGRPTRRGRRRDVWERTRHRERPSY